MTERVMPDIVFANIAADIELEIERFERSVDDERRRRSANDEDEADGQAVAAASAAGPCG